MSFLQFEIIDGQVICLYRCSTCPAQALGCDIYKVKKEQPSTVQLFSPKRQTRNRNFCFSFFHNAEHQQKRLKPHIQKLRSNYFSNSKYKDLSTVLHIFVIKLSNKIPEQKVVGEPGDQNRKLSFPLCFS